MRHGGLSYSRSRDNIFLKSSFGGNSMLQAKLLPKFTANLVSTLSDLKGNNF